MAKLRKTLPRDFTEILRRGDLAEQIAVFDRCEIDAHDGDDRATALSFIECSEDLTRWLIEHGADIEAESRSGLTPLTARAAHGTIEALIAAGAQVNPENRVASPLRRAMGAFHIDNSLRLMAAGADPDRWSDALARAVQQAGNVHLLALAPFVAAMIDAGVATTDSVRAAVTDLGTRFERHRADFNRDTVEAHSAALDEIYRLTDVTPVPSRSVHDGNSPIVAQGETWQQKHEELWNLLVPARDAAATLQGEIVRVTGRIAESCCVTVG